MKAYTTEEINENIDAALKLSSGLTKLENEKIIGWMIANGYRKEDKHFGRAYRWTDGTVFYFTTNDTAFGFNYRGEWVNLCKTFDLTIESWQPYPQEKWEARLLEYAKKRGYKNGNYRCILTPLLTQTVKDIESFFMFGLNNLHLYHGESCKGCNMVFNGSTGIWAEIVEEKIPEYTWDEIKEKLGHNFTIKN